MAHSDDSRTGVDFTDLEAAMTYNLSDDHTQWLTPVGDGARAIAKLIQEMDAQGALLRC